MKRMIRASEDVNSILQKISNKLYNLIRYELWEQSRNEYYKQIRRQFTVNGRKYTVKNDAKGRLHILSPEGRDFYSYGYRISNSLDNDTTMDMALDIINDAYEGQELDNKYKRVDLNLRLNYKYGSEGVVSLGDYIKMLEDHYESYSGERYAVCTFRGDWESEISDCIGFDGAGDAIEYAQKFIKDGANIESYKQNEGTPVYDYTYKANVIDVRTGQEIWYDETRSIP